MKTTVSCILLSLGVFLPADSRAATLNDLGLQQVVETKDRRYGGHIGYRFEILSRSNPLFLNSPREDAAKAPLMLNKAFAVGEAGNYSFGMGAMKHNIGVIYNRTSYLSETLEGFNHDTKTVFLDNVYLHSSNWTFRAGLRGVQFTNTNDGATAYNGWSPGISVARLFRLGIRQHLVASLRQSWTFSETPAPDFITGLLPDEESRLDHSSTSLSLDHSWRLSENWTLRSHSGFKRSPYRKGRNQNRKDHILDIGTSLDWGFNDYFSTSAFLDYSNRVSSQDMYSFRNWDGGLRFNASVSF